MKHRLILRSQGLDFRLRISFFKKLRIPFCSAVVAALQAHRSDDTIITMCSYTLLILLADDPAQLRAYKHLQIEEGLRAIGEDEQSNFDDVAKDLVRAALDQL